MGLNDTASAERLHIGFFGMRNAGKSSLVNAVTGQSLSLVSDVLGTTTDPVKKAMELLPLGPVVILDTPGLDDEGDLGEMRVKRAKEMLSITDIAVLVIDAAVGFDEIAGAQDKLLELQKNLEERQSELTEIQREALLAQKKLTRSQKAVNERLGAKTSLKKEKPEKLTPPEAVELEITNSPEANEAENTEAEAIAEEAPAVVEAEATAEATESTEESKASEKVEAVSITE